jgi:hypothetical protein
MVFSSNQINQTKSVNKAEQENNSTVTQELKKIEDLRKLQNLQSNADAKTYESLQHDAKRVESSRAEKGYQAKLQKDPGIQVLSSLAKDLAALGIIMTPKSLKKSSNSKLMNELEQMINKSTLNGDKVELNNLTKEAVRRMQGREEKQHGQEKHMENEGKKVDIRKLVNSSDVKEAVQQYANAYAEKLIKSKQESSRKINDQQENIEENLFNKKDVQYKSANDKLESSRKTNDQQKNIEENMFLNKDVQYLNAAANKVVMSNPEVKEKIDQARDSLKEKGFSEKDIKILEKSVKRSLKIDIASKLQDSFIQNISLPKIAFQLVSTQEGLGGIFESSIKEDNYKVDDDLAGKDIKRTQDASSGKKGKEHQIAGPDKSKNIQKFENTAELKEAVQQFSGAFMQYVVAASPDARDRLEDSRNKLRNKGFSEKEIIAVERAVKQTSKAEYASNIKDSLILHTFSHKKSFQSIVTAKQLNNAFDKAIKEEKLSGISSDKEVINEQLSRISEVSHEEIREFIREAVESRLMARHLSDRDNRDEVKKLVELGYKVGFNFDNFLKTWEKKKFDLGLFVMEVEKAGRPENAGEISIGEVSAGGVNDKNGYEMTKDEERELLINQLRAEYMKKAITGDPFAVFSFTPKIRKLKNGLIKLGLETEVFSRIEKEAKVLARFRTLEMLKESFIERSTYYELSGPAYGLLKNKMKGLVSNLKNLDMNLTKEELDTLRDEANRQMHDHTIIELKSAASILENHDNPTIEKNVPFMIKLIQRLKEESLFSHNVGEDIDEVVFRHDNGQKQVKEHA